MLTTVSLLSADDNLARDCGLANKGQAASAQHFVGAHKVARRLERLLQTSSTVIYTLWFESLSSSNVGRGEICNRCAASAGVACHRLCHSQ